MEKTAVSSGFYVRRINLSHPLFGSVLDNGHQRTRPSL